MKRIEIANPSGMIVPIDSKVQQLRRAKRIALLWLIGAACIFLLATIAEYRQWLTPWPTWAALIKMAAEAALVGGLADWFAVSALFRPIPARFPIPHTNIVANNKSAVANNLSQFVKDKFFNEEAITRLVNDAKPAQGMARWLRQPDNADRLSRFFSRSFAGVVNTLDDKPIQDMLVKGVKRAVGKIDFTPMAAGTLRVLTKEQRHQEVLDQLLVKIADIAQREESQAFIADKLEYRRLEKILPTTWLSEQGADIASKALISILADIAEDREHPVRLSFDRQLNEFAQRMESDPAMAEKMASIKARLLENDALQDYLVQVWGDVKVWLIKDVAKPEGKFATRVSHALQEVGRSIENDSKLADAVNVHIYEAGRAMAPELADFLTEHIRKTILAWDDKQMAEQIELNIGKDLQKVRINGTLVGGLIGACLFLIERAISLF